MSASNKLTANFASFFRRINPSQTYTQRAATAHANVTSLIEDSNGPCAYLRIKCFLQGSYKRDTAIYTINDVDLVALCSLSYKPTANRCTRDQIFEMVGDTLSAYGPYNGKVHYHAQSICVKVELESVKVEVLPAIRVRGEPHSFEPFYIFKPSEDDQSQDMWETTFARRHQALCEDKNAATGGMFIPMIKVLKHLRSTNNDLSDGDAVSFHLECLLFAISNSVYCAPICECIEAILGAIASLTPKKAISSGLKSPCKEKLVFDSTEWSNSSYRRFHAMAEGWHALAASANGENDKKKSVSLWKQLLGDEYFPAEVSP